LQRLAAAATLLPTSLAVFAVLTCLAVLFHRRSPSCRGTLALAWLLVCHAWIGASGGWKQPGTGDQCFRRLQAR
jgi:hypothetical protein